MNVSDFEERVWEIENIRIAVRRPSNTNGLDYAYVNACSENTSITHWLETRVTPNVGGGEVIVIGGNGEEPHGRSLLRTVRNSYARD